MSDNGYHDKIRKVLAMLEGAKTPGEAQAASLALQRLMARSGLTAEQVDALGAENVQFPVTQDGVYIGTNDVAWKKMLAAVIGENFRCEAIACSAERNARMKTVVFVGLMNLGEGRKPRIDAGIRGIRSNGYEDGYRYGTGRTLD